MQTIYSDIRKSGISLIGDLPWGVRICQFYQTEQDLLDILIPYFIAGLENNESCLWIASDSLAAEDARKAMKKAVPHFQKYVRKKQIEIISGSLWSAGDGDPGRIVISKLDRAISAGFDGLRLAANAVSETEAGKTFPWDGTDIFGEHNVIGIFTYPRDEFNAIGLMEVVKKHRYALVRDGGNWEIIKSSEAWIVKDALKRSEEKFHSLFSNMLEGFAYYRVVLDAKGRPRDYVFLEINESFERLTGLKSDKIIGRRVTAVLPGIEEDSIDWIGRYGEVAMTGRPVQFEGYSQALRKWYSVSAFSPHKGYIAVTFTDISERKHAETELRVSRRFLEIANRHSDLSSLLQEFVKEMKGLTGCAAIGIRLLDENGNIPYRAYDGFSRQFHESENPLSIRTDRCMCINVIKGTGDPGRPFYTKGGSFYTNESAGFLAAVTEKEKRGTRNVCFRMGYRSVALVPIRAGAQIIGLVHLADPEENMIPRKTIELLEKAASALGVGALRALAEEELRSQREWFHVTLTSIGDAVIATDASGRITFLNPVAVSLTGWTRAEALGQPIGKVFRIINEVSREPGEDIVDRVLKEGSVINLTNNTALITREGTEIPIEDSAAPIKDSDDNVSGVVLVFHDGTEKRRAQQVLQRSRDEMEMRVEERTRELGEAYDNLVKETSERKRVEAQLRQVQKMEALGTLTGGIAHDFNNILAAIIGFAEMVVEDLPQDGQEVRRLKNVLKAALRGRDLIRQMLTFSRKTEIEKKPLKLSAIMKETLKLLRASIPTTIRIEDRIQDESDLILADPTQIQQVLMNLSTNAAYAMRDKGGMLSLELNECRLAEGEIPEAPSGRYMRLAVRDTGVGIQPDVIDKIFDPFFTTKQREEGTGLGLSVVHGIVHQCEGHITVESEPEKGTTFNVYFPKIMEESAENVPAEEAIPRGRERILFIDDEEMLVEMGQGLLEKVGYEVVTTTSSIEALSLIRDDPSQFDLVITDQTMPDITGISLAREILVVRPDIPIILCTGHSESVSSEKVKEMGIREFLMKPLTKRELVGAIGRVLDANSET
ncbi:MAG: Blue-light-activated protein [Syntrophorhabdus sp. PtaB.Bin006]|nr:MAG: Blue-light-activated protein [Syntrophorhabdus sp. PtaB.Bin006]